MENFECSVEICERDWECFFAECEQSNLLPPSSAGVDSGLSDIDETGSILAKRLRKVNRTAGHSEADRPIDGPPDCAGSPVEHYLSRHAVGGEESVLSGSEEDIDLRSVNIFFERLNNLTEAERLTEPSHARGGKNREAVEEEEWFSDGKRASCSSWQKNFPNSLSASGERAVGKETTQPVDTISNINTMKKDVLGSKISPDPAASNAVQTNKSANPETGLFTGEEACTETRVNEATQLNQARDSPACVVCSGTAAHADGGTTGETRTPLNSVYQEHLLTDSSINLEMVTHVNRKGGQNADVLPSDATRTNKAASQESSHSASIKRKRRKKRRLRARGVHGLGGQVFIRHSDSEEERHAWRGGTVLCLSQDINLSHLNEPPAQKNISSLTSYSATSHLPVNISVKEIKVDLAHYNTHRCLQESMVRKGRRTALDPAENNATNEKALSQTDDRAMSAPNDSGNMATHLQLSSRLHTVRITDGVTGRPCPSTEAAHCGRNDSHAGSLQKSDQMNHSINCCEDEQNAESCTADVKSIRIVSSAESNDLAVEISQKDKLSAAKSVLAVEAGHAGHAGRDEHTLCQREAEPQQQLGIDCQDADTYRFTLKGTPLSGSSSDDTKPKKFKPGAWPFLEMSSQVGRAESTSDASSALANEHFLAQSPTSFDIETTARPTEHPPVPHTLSTPSVLSERNTTAEGAELAASQIMAFQSGNPPLSGDITVKRQRETKPSMSEDLTTSPPVITPMSSCCTLDTESVMSISNENVTDMSGSSCLSVNQNGRGDQGEASSPMLEKLQEGDGTSECKSQSVSNDTTDLKCDSGVKAEEIITAFTAECEPPKAPDSTHSVFTMSSFWTEMEKLTINDILSLRMISKAASSSSLPPLQESEKTSMFALADSSFLTQPDESKPDPTDGDAPSDPHSVETSSGSVPAANPSSSSGVMWESLEADVYPGNMMLTSVGDISEESLRNISKNVTVHNLHALGSESLRCSRTVQTLQTLDEGGLQNVEDFTDGHGPKQEEETHSLASLSTDGYRISLSAIFHYLFSGKQSVPSQSATDNITSCYIEGNSVSETYDLFFSEFDIESFFYPLILAEDQTKDELVPVVSYSRSANRSLEFPEAYDHFMASSSSEESSVDSDEEDSGGPVRVVTRFTRASSTSPISTDIYEHFFSDSDLRQNFFWKTTLSFRNISLYGSTAQKQTLSNPPSRVPVGQSGRSFGTTVPPLNAPGNGDAMFPEPLLCQQPFRNEDFQTAVSNPGLNASLLPLRQSDMCLVCIAFASWVLKTANPQVGDTWKAVLLANVSALSAIRYLREYVKTEAAASEENMSCTATSDY
ncbi:PGC-1 and ERR-induced regulator in muscle protein 1 [Liparis tanakae]|uniref:PGC-1 and ERR-induced regulator in muscle protein 1 n=1 Tax=Liparis tanakae TaxID=230148 RepID=A0A4Z2JBR6_9TELE|nr:PGC-1 and ERR-induced regulator in muscle protein 1 [Liparis tanakae]